MKHLPSLVIAYLSLFVMSLGDSARGPIYPEILKQFDLTQEGGSWFFIIASALSLFSGFGTQYVLKGLGYKKTLLLGVFSFALSQGFNILSTQFWGLLVGAFFLGISLGTVGVVVNVLVLRASPAGLVQKLQSGLHTMFGLASLIAPLGISFFMQVLGWNWQQCFQVTFALAVILFLCSLFVPLIDLPSRSSTDELSVDLSLKIEGGDSQRKKVTEERSRSLNSSENHQDLKPRLRLLLATFMGAYVAFELLISLRLSLYCREVFSLSLAESNYFTSGFFMLLTLGRFIYFFWSPPLSQYSQIVLAMSAGWIFSLLGFWVHPIFLAGVGLAVAPIYPLIMSWVGRYFPHSVGTIASDAVGMSGITVVTMHWLTGRLSDVFGLATAMTISSVFALGCCFLAVRTRRVLEKEFSHVSSH